jgi:alanine racemase
VLAGSGSRHPSASVANGRGAWLEIDLDAIRHNIGLIRSLVGDAAVAQVVKAEAYGHGMIPVSQAIEPVVDALCVATLDEAVALRPHVSKRIILLYPVPHAAVAEALELEVELPVMSATDLETIGQAVPHERAPVPVHLAVDTGMGRGGLQPEDVLAVATAAQAHPRLELAGLWTHLHSPEDAAATEAQLQRFESVTRALRAARLPVPPRHASSSGGIFTAGYATLDVVRPGLASYGVLDESLPLAPQAVDAARRLRPAMSLKARPIAFSTVLEGGTVGYGGTWRAQRPSRIAVLPVGYGDGYLRGSQPGAEVLVRGRRVPLVGRVSMDAVTVDVTDLPGLDHSDEFVLLGSQGDETITAGELARRRNTIAWEVLSSMAQRLARVYHPSAGTVGAEGHISRHR